jgi:hypothetical protein
MIQPRGEAVQIEIDRGKCREAYKVEGGGESGKEEEDLTLPRRKERVLSRDNHNP